MANRSDRTDHTEKQNPTDHKQDTPVIVDLTDAKEMRAATESANELKNLKYYSTAEPAHELNTNTADLYNAHESKHVSGQQVANVLGAAVDFLGQVGIVVAKDAIGMLGDVADGKPWDTANRQWTAKMHIDLGKVLCAPQQLDQIDAVMHNFLSNHSPTDGVKSYIKMVDNWVGALNKQDELSYMSNPEYQWFNDVASKVKDWKKLAHME